MGYWDKLKAKLPSKTQVESAIQKTAYGTGKAIGTGIAKTVEAGKKVKQEYSDYQKQKLELAKLERKERLSEIKLQLQEARLKERLARSEQAYSKLKPTSQVQQSNAFGLSPGFGSFSINENFGMPPPVPRPIKNGKKRVISQDSWVFGQMPRL